MIKTAALVRNQHPERRPGEPALGPLPVALTTTVDLQGHRKRSPRRIDPRRRGPMNAHPALRETGASDPLIVVSTWRCRPGREDEFERLADQFAGHSAVVLHEATSPEYHVAHRFADRAAMQHWLDGAERVALHLALANVADRVGSPQRLSGLEPWFASVGKPPRWKMWLASFLGAYPLVVLFQWQVAAHVEGLPLLVRSAVLPLILLSLMTYVMMPLVTRVLAGWLSP